MSSQQPQLLIHEEIRIRRRKEELNIIIIEDEEDETNYEENKPNKIFQIN